VTRAQADAPGEYELKAAFLFKFAKFIDWPKDSLASAQSPFTICVLGEDPFGRALDANLQGKMLGDQSFAIRRLKDKGEARRCQVVFVSSLETGHLAEIVESLQGTSVLLVGDTTGFASSGGTIEFTLDPRKSCAIYDQYRRCGSSRLEVQCKAAGLGEDRTRRTTSKGELRCIRIRIGQSGTSCKASS